MSDQITICVGKTRQVVGHIMLTNSLITMQITPDQRWDMSGMVNFCPKLFNDRLLFVALQFYRTSL